MWKYTTEPERSQTIWHNCITCLIPNTTNALMEYVILTDFPIATKAA